jgi:hypothetical protein
MRVPDVGSIEGEDDYDDEAKFHLSLSRATEPGHDATARARSAERGAVRFAASPPWSGDAPHEK